MATNCRSPVCFRTLWRCRFSPAAISAFAAASCTRLCSIPRMTISRRLTAYAWPKPSPNTTIDELTAAAEQEAHKRPEVLRLMTHPGVGPITALAFVLVLGSPDRFGCGHQIGSYLGLIPSEDSSADRQRLGHITKQGSSLLRFLLVEAAQAAVRWDPDWRRPFVHLAMRRDRRIAKVAMARKLAVSLYWMWRKGFDYPQTLQFGSHAGEPGFGQGVK